MPAEVVSGTGRLSTSMALDGRQANVDGTTLWGVAGKKGTRLGHPTAVGSYEITCPHPWGLCDMHGNVEEWCENTYGGEDNRVLRGGNWAVLPWGCRAANRFRADANARGDRAGLRICVRPASASTRPPTAGTLPDNEAHSRNLAVQAVVFVAQIMLATKEEELEKHIAASKDADAVVRRTSAEKIAKFLGEPSVELRRKAALARQK